jgi:hypothetical protein
MTAIRRPRTLSAGASAGVAEGANSSRTGAASNGEAGISGVVRRPWRAAPVKSVPTFRPTAKIMSGSGLRYAPLSKHDEMSAGDEVDIIRRSQQSG